MNFISKSTCLALSLLVAMSAAFGSGDQRAGGDAPKTPKVEAGSWGSGVLNTIFGTPQKVVLDATGKPVCCPYFWPVVAGSGALTLGGIAAYKYVPAVKQKVDAGLKFGKEKAEALNRYVKANLASLNKPVTQAQAIIGIVGGGVGGYVVWNYGSSTVAAAQSGVSAAYAKSKELVGKVAEYPYIKDYALKNNWTKAATVAAAVAIPVLGYKAYKAYQARQKTAPKSNIVKPSIIAVEQTAQA